MPTEREFGELDFRRIQQGCKRTRKKLMVWIVAATDKLSKTIERRAT
jgi:predicted Fe-S protein YdhL (DUF1289 family)